MNAMTAFLRKEPVCVQAVVVALVTLGGRFGLHFSADEIVALNVVALAVAAGFCRVHVTPNAKLPIRIGPQP